MKITILGAAGLRTPLIINAIAERQLALGVTELALMDIDAARLDMIGNLTLPLESSTKLAFEIRRTTDARQALHNANYVITTFRVGGMEGRVIDERTALELGLLGQETTGPGGFAMAMRTIPVLLHYTSLMREECSDAWLINFANPSGLLADALATSAGWSKAVGICDAPASMKYVAAALLKTRPDDIELDYFGLNHLGWIRAIRWQGVDYLPAFLKLMQEQGGFSDFPFDPDLLAGLGLIPNEYLYYYYYSRQAVENILRRGRTRGEQLLQMNEELFTELNRLNLAEDPEAMQARYAAYLAERGATYMRLETGSKENSKPKLPIEGAEGGYAGVALDLICALEGGPEAVMVLNVPNQGAITGMEEGDVVEIPCQVSQDHIQPLPVGIIPGHCLGLMKQVKSYEKLTIAAATEGSLQKAVQALTIHPLVADFTLASELVNRYRQRHAVTFPELK